MLLHASLPTVSRTVLAVGRTASTCGWLALHRVKAKNDLRISKHAESDPELTVDGTSNHHASQAAPTSNISMQISIADRHACKGHVMAPKIRRFSKKHLHLLGNRRWLSSRS